MELLSLSVKDKIELPVTDLNHVVEEINKHRRATEAIRLYNKEKCERYRNWFEKWKEQNKR